MKGGRKGGSDPDPDCVHTSRCWPPFDRPFEIRSSFDHPSRIKCEHGGTLNICLNAETSHRGPDAILFFKAPVLTPFFSLNFSTNLLVAVVKNPQRRRREINNKYLLFFIYFLYPKVNCRKDLTTVSGETALHLAIPEWHTECIKHLVKCGANVNAQDADGNTSLHLVMMKSTMQYSPVS